MINCVIKNNKFSIYDNLLEEEDRGEIWKFFQEENYSIPHLSNWIKVWRMNDGNVCGGQLYTKTNKPAVLNKIWSYIEALAKANIDLIGEEGKDWKQMSMRLYLYPRGSKISWHNDFAYTGAAIYYAHLEWGSTWGGELMIAEVGKEYENYKVPSIDRSAEDKFLFENGLGYYIMPKPNRVVITGKDVWHSTSRVDNDAGDHCRCSIVTFFESILK